MKRGNWILVSLFSLLLLSTITDAKAVDFDNGGTGSDWNTPQNWEGDAVPNGVNVFIGDNVAGPTTITITASPLFTINELGLGRDLTGTYTIDHSAGALNTTSWTNIGQGFGTGDQIGVYNLSGGSVTKSGNGENVLGGFANARGELHITNNALWRVVSGSTRIGGETTAGGDSATVGILTVNDTGRFENVSGAGVFVGRAGTGTFTHNSTNTSTITGNLVIGDSDTAQGTVEINDGTLNVSGGLFISENVDGMGTFRLNDGSVTFGATDISIGRFNTTNTPLIEINGGTLTHARNTVIGFGGQGAVAMTGGQFDTGRLIIGEAGNTAATLNISGEAVLNAETIENIGGAAATTINVTGSQASINVASGTFGDGDLEVNEGATSLSYFADEGGVSTINLSGAARIATTDLLVDLTGIGGGSGNLDLIDYATLDGNFNSVQVLFDAMPLTEGIAGNLNDFEYFLDLGNGSDDAISLQFQLPALQQIPEPSSIMTWCLVGIGPIGFVVRVKR